VIFGRLFGKKPAASEEALYAAIVAAARQEHFYAQWQVPDTLDGRFDMLSLHMFLVLDHLHKLGADAAPLAQALTDRFFADMDAALREVGVGDLTVGKKVRKMAEAFYGRATAYRAALSDADESALEVALQRNVYAAAQADAKPLANWVRTAHVAIGRHTLADLAAGRLSLAP
jgi:cytochrome b pre-mRNA-processing protein 3